MKRTTSEKRSTRATHFSTLDSGLRDETRTCLRSTSRLKISVPSTRVYAMKPVRELQVVQGISDFSTLDSGLRDETAHPIYLISHYHLFQYPRLGSTR